LTRVEPFGSVVSPIGEIAVAEQDVLVAVLIAQSSPQLQEDFVCGPSHIKTEVVVPVVGDLQEQLSNKRF
jgi:hypothetical protein